MARDPRDALDGAAVDPIDGRTTSRDANSSGAFAVRHTRNTVHATVMGQRNMRANSLIVSVCLLHAACCCVSQ